MSLINTHNFCLITLDSLRYDVATIANTPNILKAAGKDSYWHKTYAHATYTLPSHIAMLTHGRFPNNNFENEKFPYNTGNGVVIKIPSPAKSSKSSLFSLSSSPNVVKGFELENYKTIGIGGVGWFNTNMLTSKFWGKEFFQEFYWKQSFEESNPNSFENQIKLYKNINKNDKKQFFFINVSSTHYPYRKPNFPRKINSQVEALEYVDDKIQNLFDLLPKPIFVIITADHGECFPDQDDGFFGHGFSHISVSTVPSIYFIIK